MKLFPTVLLVLNGALAAFPAFAQQRDTSLIHRPFQISFASPMGTNGMESGKVVNNFSINIISGYAGGLEGAEFGGVFNAEKHYVKGVQFAGFGNAVMKETQGAQFAGFFNFNGGYTKAAQFAGFSNIVADSASSGQFAGFANVVTRANKGVMMAGFANYSHGFNGLQAAGFTNVSTKTVRGAQLAGFANVTVGDVTGSQIAGFLNLGRKIKGSQIGFINIADSISGAPIGFLSLVRHGYHHAEIGASESLYGYASVKLGVRHFYNIFAGGLSPKTDRMLWAFGYGVGTDWRFLKIFGLNADMISYHINEDIGHFTANVNILNRAQVDLSVRLAEHFSLFAGPTFNLMLSNVYNPDTQKYGSRLVSRALYERQYSETNMKFWLGFNAGLRL